MHTERAYFSRCFHLHNQLQTRLSIRRSSSPLVGPPCASDWVHLAGSLRVQDARAAYLRHDPRAAAPAESGR